MAKRLEESPISDEEITELSKTSQVVRTYANGTNIDDDIEFDPAYLRIGQDFSFDGSVEEILSVEVRRPKSQEFFRMHPDPSYRLDTAILEDQKEREIYLVAPKLRDDLADDITSVRIVTWINSDGDVFLHVLKLPTDNRPVPGRFRH